ncbi:MAG: bifunctional UDP-sugar hydrolase/5'-nucleotidase [Elusimicrobia bacterium]|nr:bifunctional UDP-sugar hydrolase/5'-nucleotidase [Elusimicrobiota bacterium]
MRKLLALLLLLAPAAAGASSVAVYHTSDVHGWYFARPAAWDNANRSRLIGGFAALSSLLKKETTPYILLDSGDMFQGTPEGILTRGRASAELMNKLGYSAAVPGNHDYDYGEGVLKALISASSFPFVGANLYYKKDGRPADYLKPWVMVEKGGKKIAVLGLLGRHTATSTMPSGVKHLDFRDEAAEAAKWLPEMQKERPDAIVAIAHLGIDTALSIKNVDISTWTLNPEAPSTLYIARAAPGLDLVLGGHDHTGLINGYHDKASGTWFGESGYGLSYVTRAELDFDDATGRLTGASVKLVPLWIDQTGQDPAVLAMADGYKKLVDEKMGRPVGTARADLSLTGPLDSPMGDWACDITIKALGTQLAFHNTHGFRAPIRKGRVLLRDIYQAMPFDNTIVTMTVTGAQIAQLLRDNIHNGQSDMQIGGLEAAFRLAPDGSAADIRLYRGGKEIKPADTFTAATNSYLADGGDGGAVLTAEKSKSDTLVPARDIMLDAFKKGLVKPPATGRIRLIKGN